MPQEVLGGNTSRRAEKHKSKALGARGEDGLGGEDEEVEDEEVEVSDLSEEAQALLEGDFSELRDEAVERDVFSVGMSEEELAQAVVEDRGGDEEGTEEEGTEDEEPEDEESEDEEPEEPTEESTDGESEESSDEETEETG